MTKEELNAALEIQRDIDRLKRQLDTLEETGGLGAVRNSDISVMSSDTSIYPGQLIVEIEQEIQELKARQAIERTVIQRFVDKQVLEEIEYKLLRYRYVECLSWKYVALRIGYTKRHVTRIHNMILEKMSLDVP